ncbi:MAG TPA: hypothetical protein VFH45_10385 [Acidimicrobiales bacterium]|nr:hypothetical protein [Acidimicrobiales bacterium]
MTAAPILRTGPNLDSLTVGTIRTVLAALSGEPALVVDLSTVQTVDPPAVTDLLTTIQRVRRTGTAVRFVRDGVPVDPRTGVVEPTGG